MKPFKLLQFSKLITIENDVGRKDTLLYNIQSISRITILGIDGIFMIHSLPDIDIIIVFCSTLHCRKILDFHHSLIKPMSIL